MAQAPKPTSLTFSPVLPSSLYFTCDAPNPSLARSHLASRKPFFRSSFWGNSYQKTGQGVVCQVAHLKLKSPKLSSLFLGFNKDKPPGRPSGSSKSGSRRALLVLYVKPRR